MRACVRVVCVRARASERASESEYEDARVLGRVSCLRALVWRGQDAYALVHMRTCMRARAYSCLCDACSRVEQVYAPRFFFLLLIPAVLPVSFYGSVFLLVEKTTREGAP